MWNLDKYCKLIFNSVRLRPLLWKFLINMLMFWFVFWWTQVRLLIGRKVSHDQLALSLNLGIFWADYRQINSHSNTGEESKHTSHHNQLSNSDIAMYTVYPQTDMTNNMCDGSNCTTQWHCYVHCLPPDRHDKQYVRRFKLHHSMTLLCTLSIPRQIWQTILKTCSSNCTTYVKLSHMQLAFPLNQKTWVMVLLLRNTVWMKLSDIIMNTEDRSKHNVHY